VSVPFPTDEDVNLDPPDAAEVQILGRGIVSAVAPPDGLTELQDTLIEATFHAMTGYAPVAPLDPITPSELAEGLRRRSEAFRTRIVQVMLLGALVLRPIPPEVAERVATYARALGVDDEMLEVAQRFAHGSLGLASIDFQRNGYTAEWSDERQSVLHTSRPLADAWELSVHDPDLAARWKALEDLPDAALGRRVADFYRARGFAYPGHPGSAPPLLAQHDWVHVVADYGTKVESELEVFAFIARANDDPRAFSLLAMVVSLFETGYLRAGAGLFESSPGQLSRQGVAQRVADGMRRGALTHGSIDFLAVDWFDLAALTVDEVREHFGVVVKSDRALAAGSVGPWEPGGISEFQWRTGVDLAERDHRPYEPFGAAVVG
jgi:hypothetical protein